MFSLLKKHCVYKDNFFCVFEERRQVSICSQVVANILLYVLNILCIAVYLLCNEILAKFIKQQENLSSHIATINKT